MCWIWLLNCQDHSPSLSFIIINVNLCFGLLVGHLKMSLWALVYTMLKLCSSQFSKQLSNQS